MADWIAEVDRIDHYLHSIGIPDGIRMKAVSEIADVLAQADKARRIIEREQEAARLLHTGATRIAERHGCHISTVYRRAARARKCQKTG